METKPKKREWVKNAAIIFLAVLLALTFFSNTIMNRTLPEIATEYVTNGTITARVRGTGTVEALGVYEVKAAETREIRAVMVKSGQKVDAGDVLFVLGEGDSEEIETATETLRQLKLQYQQTALSAPNYAGELSRAQKRYNEAVAAEAAAYAELSGNTDLQDAIRGLDAAKEAFESADLNYKLANDTAGQSLETAMVGLTDFVEACTAAGIEVTTLNDAVYSLNNAREAILAADGSLNVVVVAVDKTESVRQSVEKYEFTHNADIAAHADVKSKLTLLKTYLEQAASYLSDETKNDDLMDCAKTRIAAQDKLNTAQSLYDGFSSMFTENYNNAVAERQAAESALKAVQETADDSSRSSAMTGLSLQDLSYQIERAQEKLDSLTGGTENQITANVSGTVTSIAVTAGNTAAKDTVIATIEVPDMGYSVSFSVTTDQAKRLHLGDTASVTSFYWGSRVDAVLSAIKPDPKNPQTNKLLEFDVSGDVSAGQELTISIGERGENYDFVVPNSAIRTDSNGKFVLVVQAKNSALGNRYFARRVNVEVIASDDNNSAVSGSLEYGDYVITTASGPIKSGDQVRMAEG